MNQELKLELLRITGGNLDQAQSLYQWIIQDPLEVCSDYVYTPPTCPGAPHGNWWKIT